MSGPKNALAAWSQSALRPVELPSGMKALIVIPDVNLLVRKGKLPDALTSIAMQFSTTGIDMSKMTDPNEVLQFIQLTYELIADSLEYIAPPGSEAWEKFKEGGSPTDEGWEPVSLTGAELAEMRVDQDDLAALGSIVGRMTTPNEVTAKSRHDRGLVTAEGAEAARAAEGGSRVGDFAPFRSKPASADDRPDGEDVRSASVGSARSAGSGRRSRARRSPSG